MAMLLAQECVVKWSSITPSTDNKIEAAIHQVFTLALRNGQLDVVEVLLKHFTMPEEQIAMKNLPHLLCESLSSPNTQLNELFYQFFDFLLNSRAFTKQRLHHCDLMLQWPPSILCLCESIMKVALPSLQYHDFSMFKLLQCIQNTLANTIAASFQPQKPEPPPVSLCNADSLKDRNVYLYYQLQASYRSGLKDYIVGQRCMELLRVSKWSCLHESAAQGWCHEMACLLKLLRPDEVDTVDSLGRTALCVAAAGLNDTAVGELIGGNAGVLAGGCSPIVLCVVKTLLTSLKPSRFYGWVKLFVDGSEDFTAVAEKAFWGYEHLSGKASDLRQLLVYTALWKQYRQLLEGLPVSRCEPRSWEAMATIVEMLINQIVRSRKSESVLTQEEVDLTAIAAAVSTNKTLGNMVATHASPKQLKHLFRWAISLQDVVNSLELHCRNGPRYDATVTVEVGAVDVACLYCPGRVNRNVNQETQAVDAEKSALFLLQSGCVLSYPWLAAQKCYWNLIQQHLKIGPVHWPSSLSNKECIQSQEARLFGWWHVVASAVTEGETSIISAAMDAGCPDIIMSAESSATIQSLLNVAVKKRQLQVVRHLLEQGCDPLVKLPVQPYLSRKLEQVGVDKATTVSPFHWAVQFGDVDMVAVLLSSMGDVSEALKKAEQCTSIPQELVFEMAAQSGNRAVVQLLSDLIGPAGTLGWSHMVDQAPKLQTATGVHGNHCYGWFSTLMELGAIDNPKRVKEHTISVYQPYFQLSRCNGHILLPSLLQNACRFNQLTVVDAIQRVVGSLEFAQRTDRLLGIVSRYGYNELLLYILNCWKQNKGFRQMVKDNINRSDERGYTPLAWAVFEGHDRCVETLIEHGANVSWIHANSGVGLLHLACVSGSVEIVKTILQYLPESMRNLTDKAGLDAVSYASGYGNVSLLCALYGEKPENLLLAGNIERTVSREQKYFLLLANGWFKTLMMRNMQHKQQSTAKGRSLTHFTIRSEGPFRLSWKKGLVVADVWKAALGSCHYDVIEAMYASSFGQIATLISTQLSHNYASLLRHHLGEGLISRLIASLPPRPEMLLEYSAVGTERNLLRLYSNSAGEIISRRDLAFRLALNAAVRGQVSVVDHLVRNMNVAVSDPSSDGWTLAENAMAFGHRSECAVLLSLMAEMAKTTDYPRLSSALTDCRSAIPLKLQWLLGLQFSQETRSFEYFARKRSRRRRTIAPSTLFLSCCWTRPELQCMERSVTQLSGRKLCPMTLHGVAVDVDWGSFESNMEIIRQSFGCGPLLSTELLLHAFLLSDLVLGVVAEDVSSNPRKRRDSVVHFGTKPLGIGDDGLSHYLISIVEHDQSRTVVVDIKRAVKTTPTISSRVSVDETLRELCRKTAQLLERFLHRQIFVGLATASLSEARDDVVSFLYSSSACKGLGGFCQYVADCSELYDDIQALIPPRKRNTQCLYDGLFDVAFIDAVDKVSIRYVPGLSGIDSGSITTLVHPHIGRLVWPFDMCDGKLFCLPGLFPWMPALRKRRAFILRSVASLRLLHLVVKSDCDDDVRLFVDWKSFGQMFDTLRGLERVVCGLDTVFRNVATWFGSGTRLHFRDQYRQMTCKALRDVNTIKVQSCTMLDEVDVSLSSGILTVRLLLQDGNVFSEEKSEIICYYPYENFTVVIPEATCLVRALFHDDCGKVGYDMIDASLRSLERLLQNQFDGVKIDTLHRVSHDAAVSPSDVTKCCGVYSWLLDGTGNQSLRNLLCNIASATMVNDESGFQRWTEFRGRSVLHVSDMWYDRDLRFIPFILVEMPQFLLLPCMKFRHLCCFTASSDGKYALLVIPSRHRIVYSRSTTKRMTVWIPITEFFTNTNISVPLHRFSVTEMEVVLEYLEVHSSSFDSHLCAVLIEQLRSELNHFSPQTKCLPERDRRLPGVIIFDDSATAWTVGKPRALSTLLQKTQLSVVPHMDNNNGSASCAWLESCDGEGRLHWPLMPEKPEEFEFAHLQEIDKQSGFSLHVLKVVASCEHRLRTVLQSESLQVSVTTGGTTNGFHTLCIASDIFAVCGMVELVSREEFNRPLQRKLENAGLSHVSPSVVLGNVFRDVDIVVESSGDTTRNVELSDGTLVIRLPLESTLGAGGSRIRLSLRSELEIMLKNAWLESCRHQLASKLKKTLVPKFLGSLESSFGRQVSDSNVVLNVKETAGRDFVCSLEPPRGIGEHLLEAPFEDMLDRMRIEDLLFLSSSRGQRWLFALCSAVEIVLSCGKCYRSGQYLSWCNHVKLSVSYCPFPEPVVSVMPSGLLEFVVCMNSLAVQPTARAIAFKMLESAQNRGVPQPAVSRPLLRSLHPSPQHSHIDFAEPTGLFFSSVGQEAAFNITVSSASGHMLCGPLDGVEIDVKAFRALKKNNDKKRIVVADSVKWIWQKGAVSATWRPSESGWYRIDIKLNGEHIKHSPCRSFVYSDRPRSGPYTKLGTGVRCVTAGSQLRFLATYDHRFQPSAYRFQYPVRSGRLWRLSAVNLLHHMHQKLVHYVCVTSGDLDVWISSGVSRTNTNKSLIPELKVIRLSEGVYYVVVTPYVASSVKLMAVLSQTQQPLSVHFADGSDNWNCLSMGFVLPGNACPNKSLLRRATEPREQRGLNRKRSVRKRRPLQRMKSPVVRCTAGDEVEFLLDAFDEFGNKHTIGGSVSRVTVRRGCRISPHREISDLECRVTDLRNGTYAIKATLTNAGIGKVLLNGVPMDGQTVEVVEAFVHGPECELLTDIGAADWRVGEKKEMSVRLKDRFGNTFRCAKDAGLVEAHLNGEACVIQCDKKSNTMSVLVTPRIAGRQTLAVKVCGHHVKNSPYTLNARYTNVLQKRKVLKKSLDRLYGCVVRRTMLLHRDRMFEDAFGVFRGLSGKDLYRPLWIKFDREMGIDVGGLRR